MLCCVFTFANIVMPLIRNDDGLWELKTEGDEHPELKNFHPSYSEALPRYFTALDKAFTKAKEKCEFEFLLTLLRVRGIDNRGIGDPYDTTLRAVPLLYEVHNRTENYEAARHLQLLIYGHIVEASEPYEILSNLVNVSLGGRFSSQFFPYKFGTVRPESPSFKIKEIEKSAVKAGIPEVCIPLNEIWDRELRNSIFHADYILNGGEVLTRSKRYSHEEIMTKVTRAVVYHEALAGLYRLHIQSYSKSKAISVHPEFSKAPGEQAIVIVRDGHGVVGLTSGWTKEEIAQGKINWRVDRFNKEEIRLLEDNPTLTLLPKRTEEY